MNLFKNMTWRRHTYILKIDYRDANLITLSLLVLGIHISKMKGTVWIKLIKYCFKKPKSSYLPNRLSGSDYTNIFTLVA